MRPGDIIFADEEGVVVIPPEYVGEVIEKAEKNMGGCDMKREEVRNGKLCPKFRETDGE